MGPGKGYRVGRGEPFEHVKISTPFITQEEAVHACMAGSPLNRERPGLSLLCPIPDISHSPLVFSLYLTEPDPMPKKSVKGRVQQIVEKRAKNQKRLKKDVPLLFEGFDGLMKAYYQPSALNTKYKELIAVALSVSRCCIPCLAIHMKNAVEAGATREEVINAAKIGVEFGGGPSFVVIRNNLLDFLDELAPEGK
jgi:AhpD family alkylhydroperoxidase